MKEKTIISHQNDGLIFLEIRSEEQFINNVQDVLELFGELYGQYYDGIILYERNITPDFFDLQTRFFRSSPTIAFGLLLSATGRNIRAVASKPLSAKATEVRR